MNVSDTRANTYKIVSPLGIDRVMINIAATPPITPALLFMATFVIMVNMVQIGTTTKVTQKASWKKVFNKKKTKA